MQMAGPIPFEHPDALAALIPRRPEEPDHV